MASAAATGESSVPGSATARAIINLIEASPYDASGWLLNELTMFNVKVNRTTFPNESREFIFNTLDDILKLATTIPQDDPLAFASYIAFILFPRLILRSLPPGCQGKYAAQAFRTRCEMFNDGRVADLIKEAHDSQVTRVTRRIHDSTQPSTSFPKTARAASLAGGGAVGKACQLAFSYGTERDPAVAATFLAKLTRSTLHTHVPAPPTAYKTAFVPIPLKTVTDAFTGMPKKSAPHRDGWTWELFRDMVGRQSTAGLLRKFVEMFVNGSLPKDLWTFLSSALMIPFHKLSQLERSLRNDPSLRPITIGALLCRFSIRATLRMKRKEFAEIMLRDDQFSYGVPGGVQKVILAVTIALQKNPDWVCAQTDLRNAHTDCSRGLIWQELERDPAFHYLIQIFIHMYGIHCAPQWHYGNGPDQPPTSCHGSGDGLRQGESAANAFFAILSARLYRAFTKVMDGKGILLGLADDCNILGPPEVVAKVVGKLPELAMSEAGLQTQAMKNRIYVQPSARAGWIAYLEENPRSNDPSVFSVHDIPDGRIKPPEDLEAFYDPLAEPSWPESDGINILGTPYGSPAFVEAYLDNKLSKHKELLAFITDVAKAGYPREAHKMLTGSAVPRLSHVLKSVPKDQTSEPWMKEVDKKHMETWMECVGALSLHNDMTDKERQHLADSVDLPPQFGGVGLQSLIRAADEEMIGSWASITADLITYFRAKSLPVYDELAEALEAMADEETETNRVPAVQSLLAVSARSQSFLADMTENEMDFATATVMGERLVEIPGRYTPADESAKPERVVLPEPRMPADYATATCKHECAILKQSRHIRQAYTVWTEGTVTQRALMLSRSGQCGVDTSKAGIAVIQAVASMDRPEVYSYLDISEAMLYSAATLHLQGLPFDYDALRSVRPPDECPECSAPLTDPLRMVSLHERLFSWQTHMARCGGDGRRTQAHEVVKMAVKRLALCNPDPGGTAIPPNQLILEARHLRSDKSRPGDLYALAGGSHAKDVAMDIVLVSTLSKSCLLKSSSSSDYAIRQAENNKFNKDLRNSEPLQASATTRFIPLAMNQFGRRGPHFEATLREHASLLIKRPSGCRLLQGPLAVPPTVALAKVLSAWGTRLTWTAQREYAAQIIKAVETHKAASAFSTAIGGFSQMDKGGMPMLEVGISTSWVNAGGQGPAG